MGCCGSREATRHSVLIGFHIVFIAALVSVACAVSPVMAVGIAPSAFQVGDSSYMLAKDFRT